MSNTNTRFDRIRRVYSCSKCHGLGLQLESPAEERERIERSIIEKFEVIIAEREAAPGFSSGEEAQCSSEPSDQ